MPSAMTCMDCGARGYEIDGCWCQAGARENATSADCVNRPPHYTAGAIECWDAMQSMPVGDCSHFVFGCRMQAMKYIWRAGSKGDATEDLRKAIAWLERGLKAARETERVE